MAIPNKASFRHQPGFKVLVIQACTTASAAVFFAVAAGWVAAYSALFGGLIALLAHAYLAYKAFRYFGARSAPAIVQSFWSGAMGKWIITAVLFALVFVGVKPIEPLALFSGFLLAVIAAAVTPLLKKTF